MASRICPTVWNRERELAGEALAAARKKRSPSLDHIRFESFAGGRSVQILHVGPYDEEGPTLERLHTEFLPANGLVPAGPHQEIYLSDAPEVEPARLRAVLRQPVGR